jgi:pimeloyl-ACP methyl ester carboxylesterase
VANRWGVSQPNAIGEKSKVAINKNGAALKWSVTGEGRRAMMFIHGWGLSARYWDEFLSHLDLSSWCAITVDLPGHGTSPMSNEFDLPQIAHELCAIADDAGAEKLVAIGHSLGSKIAQYLTAIAPQCVLGQILLGPLGPGRSPLPPELVRQILDAHDHDPQWIRGMLDQLVFVRPRPELVDAWQESLTQTPRRVLEFAHEKWIDADVTDVVRGTTAPTLAIVGARDPLHTADYTRDTVCAVIPHTDIIILDCSHGIIIERPAEAAGCVMEFLKRFTR